MLILHDGDRVVVEYCRDIFGRELVGGVADEEACLADSTVANDNASAGRNELVTAKHHDRC